MRRKPTKVASPCGCGIELRIFNKKELLYKDNHRPQLKQNVSSESIINKFPCGIKAKHDAGNCYLTTPYRSVWSSSGVRFQGCYLVRPVTWVWISYHPETLSAVSPWGHD